MRSSQCLAALLLALVASGSVYARVPKLEGSDQICDTCVVAVRILEDFLCDPAATDFVLDIVEKQLCPSMPDVEQCDQISEALVPVLVQWLRASATPLQLCASAGVCGNTLNGLPHMAKAHAVKDGMECPLCQYVLNRVKAALLDPATQEQVKEVAVAACNHLPTEMVDGCINMVNNYEALLIAMVEAEDSAQACTFMGLCAGSLVQAVKPAPLPLPLVQALHVARPVLERSMARPSPLLGAPMQLPGGPLGGPNGCDMCKMVALEVHALLSDPAVVQSAIAYIKAMCGQAPADWQATCSTAADAYVPMLINALQGYVAQPDALCTSVHMCEPVKPPSLLQALLGALMGRSAGQVSQAMELSEPMTRLEPQVQRKSVQTQTIRLDE